MWQGFIFSPPFIVSPCVFKRKDIMFKVKKPYEITWPPLYIIYLTQKPFFHECLLVDIVVARVNPAV